TSKMRTRLRIS
nr:immunoglobulin heavy chain junction region [Mus musculus]